MASKASTCEPSEKEMRKELKSLERQRDEQRTKRAEIQQKIEQLEQALKHAEQAQEAARLVYRDMKRPNIKKDWSGRSRDEFDNVTENANEAETFWYAVDSYENAIRRELSAAKEQLSIIAGLLNKLGNKIDDLWDGITKFGADIGI